MRPTGHGVALAPSLGLEGNTPFSGYLWQSCIVETQCLKEKVDRATCLRITSNAETPEASRVSCIGFVKLSPGVPESENRGSHYDVERKFLPEAPCTRPTKSPLTDHFLEVCSHMECCGSTGGEAQAWLVLALQGWESLVLPSTACTIVTTCSSSMPVQLDALLCSICWCRNLKVLEANDNYLEKLPAKLGDMKALKLLRQDEISDRILLQTNCRDAGWQV